MGGAIYVGHYQGADVLCVNVSDVEAADMAFTFNKRDNSFLRRWLAVSAVTSLTANIGFIGFYNAAATAKGPFPVAPSIASRIRWQRNHAVR